MEDAGYLEFRINLHRIIIYLDYWCTIIDVLSTIIIDDVLIASTHVLSTIGLDYWYVIDVWLA